MNNTGLEMLRQLYLERKGSLNPGMKTDVDSCLWEIADWFVKNRRSITPSELEPILQKHCGAEAEVKKFVSFLETDPGQMRFKTLLRERKESPTPPWMGKSTKEQTQPLDNVEVYTSELLPVDVTRDTGLHRDPEVEFRYTTHYYGADLISFKRDLQKLLRERTGNVNLVVAAYYIERKFKPGEIVKYKGERVRVQEHIGDRVSIWIPSRQEEVWVKASQLEKEPSYLKEIYIDDKDYPISAEDKQRISELAQTFWQRRYEYAIFVYESGKIDTCTDKHPSQCVVKLDPNEKLDIWLHNHPHGVAWPSLEDRFLLRHINPRIAGVYGRHERLRRQEVYIFCNKKETSQSQLIPATPEETIKRVKDETKAMLDAMRKVKPESITVGKDIFRKEIIAGGLFYVRGRERYTDSQLAPILLHTEQGQHILERASKPESSYLKEKPGERAGRCYELAWKHVLDQQEGTLIHGEVWSPKLGQMIGHAWVETETGYIYEPVSAQYFKKDWLYKTYKVKEFHRYTPEQGAIMAARTKNFGPWTEAERKAFLKPSYLKDEPPRKKRTAFYIHYWLEDEPHERGSYRSLDEALRAASTLTGEEPEAYNILIYSQEEEWVPDEEYPEVESLGSWEPIEKTRYYYNTKGTRLFSEPSYLKEPSVLHPPQYCPKCKSKNIWRTGGWIEGRSEPRLWRCRSCGYAWVPEDKASYLKEPSRWHPDYVAFLKTLKGKTLNDFEIREEAYPARFRRKYYRAYLGKELIVGAESVEEVQKEITKLLERASSLEVQPGEPRDMGERWDMMTPIQREKLGLKAGLDVQGRASRWIELWPEQKRAIIRAWKREERPSYLTETTPEEECQIISPQYYDVLGWLNIPVPDYSFAIETEVKERKIDEVLQKLKDGVASIHESAIFREFLLTMSKFHHYSIGNQILIMLQKPGATRVAGIKTWNELGRYVKRGEKGIAILAPCLPPRILRCPLCEKTFTERDLRVHIEQLHPGADVSQLVRQAKEEMEAVVPTPTYFKVVYVFDVSQTEGKPLPEFVVPTVTEFYNEDLYQRLMKLAEKYGLSISLEPKPELDPGIKGSLQGKNIWVKPDELPAQRLKTLGHEEAHYFTENVYFIPRADAEVIAESVAFVVCAHFGFDSGVRSFPYVALWAKEKKVLEQNLASIRKISGRMIEELGG